MRKRGRESGDRTVGRTGEIGGGVRRGEVRELRGDEGAGGRLRRVGPRGCRRMLLLVVKGGERVSG